MIGVGSFFADMVHEGAHSTNGTYLSAFGASALAVAIISGAGEWLGYLVRLVSGYASDRSGRYWLWTVVGHIVNLGAVPALALVGSWEAAAPLILLERIGKGIRNPPRDAMLAHVGTTQGQGRVFAIREGIDQMGAVLGPLLVAFVLASRNHGFRLAYALLLIPAVLCVGVFVWGWHRFPHPRSFEAGAEEAWQADRAPAGARLGIRYFPTSFWLYLGAMAVVAFGYADFNLIAFRMWQHHMSIAIVPVLYTVAMASAGLSAFIFGRLMDSRGLPVLMIAVVLAACSPPLLFLGQPSLGVSIVGLALWGIGYGVQDSLMSAPVADAVHDPRARSWAFGVFNAGYGTAWLLGSIVLGVLLYTGAVAVLVIVAMVAQLIALPLLAAAGRQIRVEKG